MVVLGATALEAAARMAAVVPPVLVAAVTPALTPVAPEPEAGSAAVVATDSRPPLFEHLLQHQDSTEHFDGESLDRDDA